MPRLAIHSTVWILMLLFCLAATENKTYPEKNVYFIDFREDKVVHNSSVSFWKGRSFRGNKSLEIVTSGFPNETLRFRAAGDTNLKGYKNASLNTRTLMDFNGPVIIEDLNDMNDQNLASHIRVKRNEPIVHRRPSSVNLLPQNLQRRNDETNIFSDSLLKASRSEYENQPDIIVDTMVPQSRHKRGVLLGNGHRRKRVKGNIGHSKHNVETKNKKNKKHKALKSPNQPVTKKTKNLNSSIFSKRILFYLSHLFIEKRNKNTKKIEMPAKAIDKSRKIAKRESECSDFNNNIDSANEQTEALINWKEDASLTKRNLVEQQQENTIKLPFVHTGKAELHVRIEKIPTNKSSFISPNNWTDHSTETTPCLIMLPIYNISDDILNATSDSENTSFYNAEVEMEAHPVESNMPRIENRNTKKENYDYMNEMSVDLSDEDAKLRAKRNQQVMSKYLRNDKNSKKSTRSFKHTEEEIGDTKSEKTRYRRTRGNRAVRTIEEIKELAEKLITKVRNCCQESSLQIIISEFSVEILRFQINELQVYVSNRSEILYNSIKEKDSYKNAIKEEPKITVKKKDISSSTSKIAENTDNRQRFAKEAILAGKRTSQVRSNGSRFARGEYRTRRRSRRKWGRWMDWSSCSVTCGKGRQIRWRHCLHDCNDAETEMEEKACQLPACPPSKFLGIF
ncbi:CILP2 protein, partial [Acromyrmex insinuator]